MIKYSMPPKLRVCLGVVAFMALVLYFNWGIWRSDSYELLGVEVPIEAAYRTDLSNRGREAGYYVVVYQLPADTQEQLDEDDIDLAQYPMFSGLGRDGFERITWTKAFPRNEIETRIFKFFKRDISETEPPSIQQIISDAEAELLATHLLQSPQTLCGGWVKYESRTSSGEIWISNFYFYVMNIEQQILIKFGLHT